MEYLKSQSPIKCKTNYVYPLTTADQVILKDGSRLEKDGKIIADKFAEAKNIALTGDVVGSVKFDGGNDVMIETSVFASRYFTASLTASDWSSEAPYTQTVSIEGIKATDNPIVDINMSSATDANSSDLLSAWGLIGRISTGDNSIEAYCYEAKPETDIVINLMVVK